MNIIFFSFQPFEKPFYQILANQHIVTFLDFSLNQDTVHIIQKADAICCFVNDIVDKKIATHLKNKGIKLILLRCSGTNNIDLNTCHKLGITVARVPSYSPHAVAEHTLALLLCLNRKIHKAYVRIKEGNFSINGLEGIDLYQKTVGIIGLGEIGKVFAKICHGLGCKVIGVDPIIPHLNFIEMASLEDLLRRSDIISLNCPLTPETFHIINQQSLQLIKPNAFLVNTGRGALIDSKALIQALKHKQLGGVALDVYEQESNVFFIDHSLDIIQDDLLMRLTTFPNVLITSHQGYLTHEALQNIAKTTLENIENFKLGILTKNII